MPHGSLTRCTGDLASARHRASSHTFGAERPSDMSDEDPNEATSGRQSRANGADEAESIRSEADSTADVSGEDAEPSAPT